MPLHLNSIAYKDIENELVANILSKDSGTVEDFFATEDKKKINGIKNIIDKNSNEIIGKTVFTMKVNEEMGQIELLDADIVLNNNTTTQLYFVKKYEQSSDSNEYYQVSLEDDSAHFDIETVGRYRINGEIENTIQSVHLSVFPFQLDIYKNIEELNKTLGFSKPIKTTINDFVVHGFSEEFMGVGSALSQNTEPCSFVIGKIESYKEVNAIIGEIEVPFTIINLKTAVGIIPVAASKHNFDLSHISKGMILGMFADIKAEFKDTTMSLDREIKEAQSKLDMNKVTNIFSGGIEQMTNIAKAINYYTNEKIKTNELYNLYIRDWFFFQIDRDVYALYNHMKMRYGNLLTEDEQINYAALILTNISNPNYKFKEGVTLGLADYIRNTVETINTNDNEGIMKGAYGIFGKESTNPIPVNGHSGLNEYFKNILLANGNEFTYERLGTARTENNVNGIVDAYLIKDKITNREICTLYICIYNKHTSKIIPEGFKLKNDQI